MHILSKLIMPFFLTLFSLNAKGLLAEGYEKNLDFRLNEDVQVEVLSQPKLDERKLSIVKVVVTAKKPQVKLVSFDADMPDHNHGMMTKASTPKLLESSSDDKKVFEVKGVKLHMPGDWRLKFVFEIDGKTQEVSQNYKLAL